MALGDFGTFEEVLFDREVRYMHPFAVDLLCWVRAEHGAADFRVRAVCADEEVVSFGFLAFGECYGDAVVVLSVGFDCFVVEDCDLGEDGRDEDVGEGAAEDLVLGCEGLDVGAASG